MKARRPEALDRIGPLGGDVREVATQVAAARDAALRDEAATQTVRGYLSAIAYLLEAALEARDAIRRGPRQHNGREDGAGDRAGGEHGAGDRAVVEDGPGLRRLRPAPGLPAGFAGPAALQSADANAADDLLAAVPEPGNLAPGPAARRRLVAAARTAARRALVLPGEIDPLTPHEARRIVAIWMDAPNDPARARLLARLVYGRGLEAGRVAERTGGLGPPVVGLELAVDLPDFVPLLEDVAEEGVGAVAPTLFLPAPRGLPLGALRPFGATSGEERDALAPVLSRLRADLARPLHLGRVDAHRADWLRRAGCDPALAGFLTGVDPASRAQMHYTAVPREVLLGWHDEHVRRGLGLKPGPVAPAPSDPQLYGARMWLPEGLVRLVFEEARGELRRRAVPAVASTRRIAAAHDAFAAYTLALLYAATAHRPVSEPFEHLSLEAAATGFAWIDDKTGRGGRGARMIALPVAARAQIRHWFAHLDYLAARLAHLGHAPGGGALARIDAARSRAAGPVFLLDVEGAPRELTAGAQATLMADVLPAPLNWARHVLRGRLVTGKAGDAAALDAFMGHAHLGAEPFAPGSGLGLRDLRALAERVDGVLADLGAVPVRGPLGRTP